MKLTQSRHVNMVNGRAFMRRWVWLVQGRLSGDEIERHPVLSAVRVGQPRPPLPEEESERRGGGELRSGHSMFAIEPDDPSLVSDVDEQGRVWRYPHELGMEDVPPVGDRIVRTPDEPEVETLSSFPLPARFPGTCPACTKPITVGESIRRSNRKRYFHEGCAP